MNKNENILIVRTVGRTPHRDLRNRVGCGAQSSKFPHRPVDHPPSHEPKTDGSVPLIRSAKRSLWHTLTSELGEASDHPDCMNFRSVAALIDKDFLSITADVGVAKNRDSASRPADSVNAAVCYKRLLTAVTESEFVVPVTYDSDGVQTILKTGVRGRFRLVVNAGCCSSAAAPPSRVGAGNRARSAYLK